MSRCVSFFVPGIPVPGGSKKGYVIRRPGQRDRIAVVDSSGARGKTWRGVLQCAAFDACRTPLEGPLLLVAVFIFPRPASHYGKRGLRSAAPRAHIIRPDVLKVARQLEDSMSGIVYRDDAQIVEEHLRKRYAHDGETPGVQVKVEQLVSLGSLDTVPMGAQPTRTVVAAVAGSA